MRIAIDVMGGDDAPDAILDGCLEAVGDLPDGHTLVLIGDEAIIREGMQEAGLANHPAIEVVHTTEVIGMADPPVSALRNKTDSSIVRWGLIGGRRAGPEKCDIIISAGNTGACVASAQMSMRRLSGVHRPGIAVTLPTFHGPVVICDVGANPEPRPTHLHQYGHMASVYAEQLIGIDNPKIALLSIGGEEGKGNALTRGAHALLKADESANYIGYIEGRELFEGKANVVACEGFTGNVVIKLAEGLSKGIFETIAHEVLEIDPELAMRFEPVVKSIYAKHDYHEYGGAPLLGANGTCVICHGSSQAKTITNAIKASIRYAEAGVNQAIIDRLATAEDALKAARAEGRLEAHAEAVA
ncbi:MAG: phosphate acyltransferase PlsX [Planctomycetota bacterium]